MSFDVGQILSTVSEWGTFFLSWVSGVAAVVSGIVAYRVYRSQTSPDVIVYVESDSEGSEMAALFVENIGNAPAFDISLSASGKIPTGDECMRETLRRFIGREIPMLQPGSKRGVYLGTFSSILSIAGIPTVDVSVRYSRRRGGRPEEDSFPIDFESFRDSALLRPAEAKALEHIARSLDGIKADGKILKSKVGLYVDSRIEK